MVSSVTLGNYFNTGGRTVFGGAGGSGLDTQSIITALVNAKSIPITQAQDKIKANNTQAAAFGQFQTLLSRLRDAANFLRNPPGINSQADNIFKFTTASVTSNTSVDGETYMTVSTSPGANAQNYSIDEITSIARSAKQASRSFVVSSADVSVVKATGGATATLTTSGDFKPGTFQFKGASITLNEGDTLNNIATKFNARSDVTGVTANVIKVDSTHYQLSFVATQSGTAYDFDFNGVDLDDSADNVFDEVPIDAVQGASDAVFTIDGVQVTRSSNSISDVVSGLTFTLFQATPPATTLAVEIKRDEKLIKDGVVNFVNVYNEFRTFVAKQTEVDSKGRFVEGAILASNATFRQISNDISNQVVGIASRMIIPAASGSLAKSAITFGDLPKSADSPLVRNILSVDEGTLTSIISTNPDEVRRAFTFELISESPYLQVYSRTNALSVNNFTLNANPYAVQTTQTLSVGSQTTKILNIADADTAIVTATPVDGEIGAGVITINGQTITLVVGDTLNQIAAKFAAVAGDTNVTATVNNIAPGQYTLRLAGSIDLNSATYNPSNVFSQVQLTQANTPYVSATPAAGQLKAGVITINGQTITLAAGDTLNQVLTKFAAVQADTGVTASLSAQANGAYKLVFNSTAQDGKNNNFNLRSTVLDPTGVFGRVTISSSGTYSATYLQSGVSTTVDLTANVDPFTRTQTTGTLIPSDSTLGANSTIVFSSPGVGQIKAGSFTFKGQAITLNAGDSINDVVQKFNSVRNATGVSASVAFNAAGQYIISFQSINGDAANDFDLTNTRFSDTLVDVDGLFTQVSPFITKERKDSISLTGPVGSALDGLTLLYSDSSAMSSEVSVTQGFGDRVYNALTTALDQNNGTIAVEMTSIQERDNRLEAQIARISEQVERFRQQLLEKFAALEQAIARVNNLLQSISATNDARNNN